MCLVGSFLSPQDSLLLTCAKLHVHKIIKDDGEVERQKRVDHALPLQMLGTKGDSKMHEGLGPTPS